MICYFCTFYIHSLNEKKYVTISYYFKSHIFRVNTYFKSKQNLQDSEVNSQDVVKFILKKFTNTFL